ncbi:MAG: SCO family protein [Sandaracinaceae bacterium]|nr:SCO family protein [Sandaracinaceae bacterium]
MTLRAKAVLCVFAAVALATTQARAQYYGTRSDEHYVRQMPEQASNVGIDEHLLARLPLDAAFRDHTGRTVHLRDYFTGNRPVILNLAYHSCPQLCSMVLNATLRSLKEVAWTVGDEFEVVTLSIDPTDTPAIAATKRTDVLQRYGRAPAARGWHFLVGEQSQIDLVTRAVGFRSWYDPAQRQYSHPAAIILVTRDGRVARYLYGIEYAPQDVRFGLLEASEGRSISTVDRVLMFCYHFDPSDSKYVLMASRIMTLGGALTLLAVSSMLFFYFRRERGRKGIHQVNGPTLGPTG